jgi:hypothetical protein
MAMDLIKAVIVAAITSGVWAIGQLVAAHARVRRLRELFGEDIASPEPFHLVYAQFVLPDQIDGRELPTHPYKKPGEEVSGVSFSISKPISLCEVRAVKYFSESLYASGGKGINISADVDLTATLDTSFITLGSRASNFKTRDVQDNPGNGLVRLDSGEFLSVESGLPVVRREESYDYGLILKIHPAQFPARTWFVCAGRSEWGTSGAAWYLAKKWKALHSFAGSRPFAVVVQVKPGQDESAVPIFKVLSR